MPSIAVRSRRVPCSTPNGIKGTYTELEACYCSACSVLNA